MLVDFGQIEKLALKDRVVQIQNALSDVLSGSSFDPGF